MLHPAIREIDNNDCELDNTIFTLCVCVPLQPVECPFSESVPGWRQLLTSTHEHPAVGMRWSSRPSQQSEA